MKRFALLINLAACLLIPAAGAAAETRKTLTSLTVDFDGDGKLDLAELVVINPASPEAGFNSNQNFMVSDAERVDLVLSFNAASGKPAVVKQKIVDPELVFMVSALESKAKGSVSVRSCYGCGAMKSWDETLTIAYRQGHFVVAGLNRDWELASHLADGEVDVIMGGCEINYLTGKGTVSKDLEPGKPVRTKFKLVHLADWSEAKQPKVCHLPD